MHNERRWLPPLHALRAFEAAARHLSFKEAAGELTVTPTAISHHIRQLEDLLGKRLFVRHVRSVALTPEGKSLYPVLRDSLDQIAEAVARVRETEARSVVTLSATVAFTGLWLTPRVADFHRRHPELDLRLHASDDPVDLRSGVADAAIRYGPGPYPGLECEKLVNDAFAPVCNPSLGLVRPEELADQTLIHFEWRQPRRDAPTWGRWLERAGLGRMRPKAQIVFTDESHAVQAAVAGQGVALASSVLVSGDTRRGTLIAPFGPRLPGYAFWLVRQAEADQRAPVSALLDWVRVEVAGQS